VPTHWPRLGAESGQADNAAPKSRGIFGGPKVRIAAALSSMGWTSPHTLLVAGEVNYVTSRPQSLWSNVLVLPNFEIGDRVKVDADSKVAISSDTLTLRGRSLEGAVLVNAHFRKADFTGAQLPRANFLNADLREAKFECGRIGESNSGFFSRGEKDKICAQLQSAILVSANLQGASFGGAQLQGAFLSAAQLQGASLNEAQLQGAVLATARLEGASLDQAQLQGAAINDAWLQGSSLIGAQLQVASLIGARLQGALLAFTELQGAALATAQLQGALLSKNFVWRTDPNFVWRTEPPPNTSDGASAALIDAPNTEPKYGLGCPQPCNWTEASSAALKSLIENSVPAGPTREQALLRIAKLEKPPNVADEVSVKAWMDLAQAPAQSAGLYSDTLSKMLTEIGCGIDGAPYVVGGLIRRLHQRYEDDLLQDAKVAAAFLDEAKCQGAHGLSQENKAKLLEIRDRRPSAPPGPPAR
jgi:uncharacterized protein YjbI with pentapeptide repeats